MFYTQSCSHTLRHDTAHVNADTLVYTSSGIHFQPNSALIGSKPQKSNNMHLLQACGECLPQVEILMHTLYAHWCMG